MKPLNNDTPGCNPISSNCVIWQGPDIPCIKLCKGDTVSEVTYKLATELCDILGQLDMSTYTLSCLNIQGCVPTNFHDLIQILINKICELSDCCGQSGSGSRIAGATTSVCPDECIVEVCDAFVYKDAFKNTVTTMTLKEYVIAAGNRICTIVQQILTIENTLVYQGAKITEIENKVNNISLTLPSINPNCIGTEALVLDDFVATLEAAFCDLRTATGTATDLYQAIGQQCVGLDNEPRLFGTGVMGTIPNWVTSTNYGTVADAINNMWLTICDMRAAIKYIKENCCPGACADFVVNITGTFSGNILTLYFSGDVPLGYVPCDPAGVLLTISDLNGNSISQYVNIIGNVNNPSGFPINLSTTPLNLLSDFKLDGTICVTNPSDGSQCSITICETITNQVACPAITLTPAQNTVNYTFTVFNAGTYKVEILSSCGASSVIATNIHTVLTTTTINGSFTGLVSNSVYVVRLTVQTYIGETLASETVCPCVSVATLFGTCNPPTLTSLPEVQIPIIT